MSTLASMAIGLRPRAVLYLLATDIVWIAAIRRAVRQLPVADQPEVVLRVDCNDTHARLIAVELPSGSPFESLNTIASLRKMSPSASILALTGRALPPSRPWDEWRLLLAEAGANSALRTPADASQVNALIARAVALLAGPANAQSPPPLLPPGWQPGPAGV